MGFTCRTEAPVGYCWDIFRVPPYRPLELSGTPYRYWSSFAIAHVLQARLAGTIDFLDAGGRDGGTLSLLRSLSLRGTYTLLDLEPKMEPVHQADFAVEVVRGAFRDFQPPRRYDAILFQSCLECVDLDPDIAWVQNCLKPGGFVLATIACRNTRRLYRGFWDQGGTHLLDEEELAPAFRKVGLEVVSIWPLAGAVSRVYQRLVYNFVFYAFTAIHQKAIARWFPRWKTRNPLALCFRMVNPVLARLDRLLPFWRIGHCVVAQRRD